MFGVDCIVDGEIKIGNKFVYFRYFVGEIDFQGVCLIIWD